MEILLLFMVFLSVTSCWANSKVIVNRNMPKKFQRNDVCDGKENLDLVPHPTCWMFTQCDIELGPQDYECDYGLLFDKYDLNCIPEDEATCWEDDYYYESFDECPLDTDTIIYLPGEYCDEFIICVRGIQNLAFCRPDQHWNSALGYCDEPHLAGCDQTATAPPLSGLPDCPIGSTGSQPHPNSCSMFIYCDNGNRSIQHCPHLNHFDEDQLQCIIRSAAKCTTRNSLRI